MKAISLYQPWAQAMAEGLKCIETRSWRTTHRGDLAICSAKRTMDDIGRNIASQHNIPAMKYGVVLCVVELYNCVPTETCESWWKDRPSWEQTLGDYSPGRFAWLTQKPRKLKNPVPVVGRQGLWNLPPETVKLIKQQL